MDYANARTVPSCLVQLVRLVQLQIPCQVYGTLIATARTMPRQLAQELQGGELAQELHMQESCQGEG